MVAVVFAVKNVLILDVIKNLNLFLRQKLLATLLPVVFAKNLKDFFTNERKKKTFCFFVSINFFIMHITKWILMLIY